MYIVAIAWLYVVVLMAVLEPSWVGGVMTFVFYGLLPLAIILFIFGTPERRRRQARRDAQDGEGSVAGDNGERDGRVTSEDRDPDGQGASADTADVGGHTAVGRQPVQAPAATAIGGEAPLPRESGLADHPVGKADGRHA